VAFAWYRSTADAATIPPRVAEQALEWLLELQIEPVSADVMAGWARWRAEHPDHERAWQRIEAVKGRLQPLSSPITADIAQGVLAGSAPARASPPALTRRRHALKTLATLTFASGLTWMAGEHLPWREWSADHRTAVGERRTLVLDDGTQLVLNTASAVNIRFDGMERRVKLLAGEILVTTAKDPQAASRPFLVETGQGTALALGTRYSVRQRDGATAVNVFAGAVELHPRDKASQTLLVKAGDSASYTERTATATGRADVAAITWAEGFIVARSLRLDDFLAELGRYTQDDLSCDPGLAGVRVSGSFPVDDIDKVLAALSTTLDVRTEVTRRLWGARAAHIVPAPRDKRS
jgi:transmembrane sensor